MTKVDVKTHNLQYFNSRLQAIAFCKFYLDKIVHSSEFTRTFPIKDGLYENATY